MKKGVKKISDKKTCPKCKGMMEEGQMVTVSLYTSRLTWAKNKTFMYPGSKKKVSTYKCNKCGYLESYVSPQ